MTSIASLAPIDDGELLDTHFSVEQFHLLRQAAGASDLRIDEFVVASAVANARRVLDDHRWMMIAQEATQRFQALLDASASPV